MEKNISKMKKEDRHIIKPDRKGDGLDDLSPTECAEPGIQGAINWYMTLARWSVQCDPWLSVLRVLERLVDRGPLRSAGQVLWLFGGSTNFRRAVRRVEAMRNSGKSSTETEIEGGVLSFVFSLREVDVAVSLRSPHLGAYTDDMESDEELTMHVLQREP